MVKVLIYSELFFLLLLGGASLSDAWVVALPLHLSPALVVGLFFSNPVISGVTLWQHSPFRAERRSRPGREQLWVLFAACALAGATISAVLQLFS